MHKNAQVVRPLASSYKDILKWAEKKSMFIEKSTRKAQAAADRPVNSPAFFSTYIMLHSSILRFITATATSSKKPPAGIFRIGKNRLEAGGPGRRTSKRTVLLKKDVHNVNHN
jgi:hypothetical protein